MLARVGPVHFRAAEKCIAGTPQKRSIARATRVTRALCSRASLAIPHRRYHHAGRDAVAIHVHWSQRRKYHRAGTDALAIRTHWLQTLSSSRRSHIVRAWMLWPFAAMRYHRAGMDALAIRAHWSLADMDDLAIRAGMEALAIRTRWSQKHTRSLTADTFSSVFPCLGAFRLCLKLIA